MNCRNFEEITGDLARGVLMDARQLAEANSHAGECSPCAARLSDERALSDGLRALAQSDAKLSASPRVETELLAAFRAGAATNASNAAANTAATTARELQTGGTGGRVDSLARPSALRWTRARTFIAAASAAAAILIFMLAPASAPDPNSKRPDETASERRAETREAAERNPVEAVAHRAASHDGRDESSERPVVGTETVGDDAGEAPEPRAVRANRREGRAGVSKNLARSPSRNVPRSSSPVRAPRDELAARGVASLDEEIATGFIPLVQEARLAEMDGGQMVRVELPRSALVRFGLPMNVERAGERVKADVLLGEDGIARAIRFVR